MAAPPGWHNQRRLGKLDDGRAVELLRDAADNRRLQPLAVERRLPALRALGSGAEPRRQLRRGARDGDAYGDELEVRVGIRVAVALVVRLVERPPQLGRIGLRGAGDRQLERLAGVAQVAINPTAESTPDDGGTSMRCMSSSRVIAAACSGPAPPNASNAIPRGSMPRSTVITRTARAISVLAIRTMPAAASSSESPTALASSPTARSAAPASSSTPPASGERASR